MRLRLAMALGLAVLVGGALPVAAAETHQVTVSEAGFEPATLEIKQGDTVEWVWESGAHEIMSGDPTDPENEGLVFDFMLTDTAPKHSHTFQTIDTYPYFSKTNPSLKGAIKVSGATPVDRKTWGWLKHVYQGA